MADSARRDTRPAKERRRAGGRPDDERAHDHGKAGYRRAESGFRGGTSMSGTQFELSVTRHIDAPREIAWKVWTDLKDEWFCPKPWRAEVIEEDLRPGGRSAVRMYGPDGEDTGPMEGIFLEVVPRERVVSTDAY